MPHYVINGKFMADPQMGIVRYGREIVKAMDALPDTSGDEITLLLPPDAKHIPQLKRIQAVVYGRHTGILWEQFSLRRYVREHPRALCVNLCNVAPFFVRPGLTVIHDIMYRVNPAHYTSARNRLSRLWHMLQYRYLTGHEKQIITDSAYSRGEIEKYYPRARNKIQVIPCAWQHVTAFTASEDWQTRYPFLRPGAYYFSLATLAKNKNGWWIIEAAKRNPDCVFAIAGRHYEAEAIALPGNVHMLGFVTDSDACALITHCRAFVYPSLYEGFGLPPLEALALGASVISSNATSLPEVLGTSVHYLNPYDPDIDFEKTLQQNIDAPQITLARFSWQKSAQMMLEQMHRCHTEST